MSVSKDPTSIFEANSGLTLGLYEELRRLATRRMATQAHGHTLQTTALIHEAWLRLTRGQKYWNGHSHFLAAAAEAMRTILIDDARRKSRVRRGGGLVKVDPEMLDSVPSQQESEEILLIDEGISELKKVDSTRAQVVILRFFGGLTTEEIAENLGIGERSVERHWACAKVWLFRWVEKARNT